MEFQYYEVEVASAEHAKFPKRRHRRPKRPWYLGKRRKGSLVECIARYDDGQCAKEEERWMVSNNHGGRGDQVQFVGSRYARHDISIYKVHGEVYFER